MLPDAAAATVAMKSMPENTSELLAALNTVGLERIEGSVFRTLGVVEGEFVRRFPALGQSELDVAAEFPFLETFLLDAEAAWTDGDSCPLTSGSWSQEDAIDEVSELEATAVQSDGRAVLLLGFIGPAFREIQGILQSARNKMLEFESLEKLHAQLRTTTEQLERVAQERKDALAQLSKARDQLEEKVAERTAELIASNAELRKESEARRAANEQLLDYQEQLRSLADRLTLAEERERRRVANYIHDKIGQTLALVKINLGMLNREVEGVAGGAVSEKVAQLTRLTEDVIADTRSLTYDLGSPVFYELGLEMALDSLAAKFRDAHKIRCLFKDDGGRSDVDTDIRVMLFHGARELLHNIVKHAAAHQVTIAVRHLEDRLELSIEDDGKGFDAENHEFRVTRSGGFGIFNLRERLDHLGGSLRIESKPGRGTRAQMTVPAKPERSES